MKIIIAIKSKCFDMETINTLNNRKFYGLGDVVNYLKNKGLEDDDFIMMNSHLFYVNFNYNELLDLSEYKIIFAKVSKMRVDAFHFKINNRHIKCQPRQARYSNSDMHDVMDITVDGIYFYSINDGLILPHISNNQDISNFMHCVHNHLEEDFNRGR